MGETRHRVAELERRRAELEKAAATATPAPSLRAALAGTEVGVIAEVKRRSPSRGDIAVTIDAALHAAAYARGGAAAISVLTEPGHFGGSLTDLERARAAAGIPILKKDFHIDPVQVLEARAAGASALLLIARALPPERLLLMAGVAAELGLEVVVEVRDETELERALSLEEALIGVNSRDLETLEIDPRASAAVIPRVPAERVVIAESGVQSVNDVRRLAGWGADAVLVGSSLSAAVDPEGSLRALTGVPRRARGR